MKRILFITTFTALTLGLVFIAGCPKPTCDELVISKVIGFTYPNLPGWKVDTSIKYYPVTIIITERNNINNIIDTVSKNIPCDTSKYLWFSINFEGYSSEVWEKYGFSLDGEWKPNNIIVIVDSTKYRDTLADITFYKDTESNCPPGNAIAVSFYHNGKYVYSESMGLKIQ